MTRRRYTKAEKVAAIVAAEASSTLAASEQADIPRSTLRGWLDNPKYADLRQNAQEGMRDAARITAFVAWQALLEAIEAGLLEPRDLVMAAGMATDKSQLLGGGPTSRTETRTLVDDLDDDEKRRLRDWIDGLPAGAPAEVPAT